MHVEIIDHFAIYSSRSTITSSLFQQVVVHTDHESAFVCSIDWPIGYISLSLTKLSILLHEFCFLGKTRTKMLINAGRIEENR